jgi:hypothetical protein
MEPTVYSHTRAIYRKLCAADRRDALQCPGAGHPVIRAHVGRSRASPATGPLTPVTSSLSRSLTDSPTLQARPYEGPEETDSLADSAGWRDRAVGRCESYGWARIRGWPAQCPGVPLHRQGHPKILSKPLRRKHLRDPPLSVGASAPPPVRSQGPGRSLPGPDASHPLHGAGGHGHSRTASYTGSPADTQADPLRKPTF